MVQSLEFTWMLPGFHDMEQYVTVYESSVSGDTVELRCGCFHLMSNWVDWYGLFDSYTK